MLSPLIIIAIVAVLLLLSTIVTVQQGTIAVITMFGKYQRMMHPGLNFKIPLVERIHKIISVQNRSVELEFQAITSDQANVYFKAMLLFSALDGQDETIKNVAFKFISDGNFMQALIRTVEGSIRGFVATKKQAEILSLRGEIVADVKEQLDHILEQWGYHLIDLQLNDITFDEAITKSMAQVVATQNLKSAAENEGQALLITRTKAAEAEGNAIKISAEAEKIAAKLRGEGVSLFRQEVAKGMTEAAKEMEEAKLDASVMLFVMWTEALKHFAENGQGNVILLDGSTEGMEKTLHQMMAMDQVKNLRKQ
jgi:regulator of protease activity HflC (stomatin/prohibitin superfamily)